MVWKKFFMGVVLAALAVVPAQAFNTEAVKAQVPFAFVASGTPMAPGVYTIEPANIPATMVLRGEDGTSVLIRVVALNGLAAGKAQLVFKRDGNVMRLSGVRFAGVGSSGLIELR